MTPEESARLTTRLLADAEGWTSSLLGRIGELRDQGIGEDAIRAQLKAAVAGTGGSLARLPVTAREAAAGVQSRVYTNAAYARHQPDDLLVWHAVGSNTCPDCLGRSGQIGTLAGWTAQGLPRRGATVCGSRCRCVLLTVERAAQLYGVRDVNPARVEDLDRLTTEMNKPIVLQQARIAEQRERKAKEGRLPKGELVLQPGDFRQEDARRGGDARTRTTSDAEVTEAKLVDAAFRAAGRNPLDPMDVGRGDYAQMNVRQRAARRDALAAGQITDIDRVMGATPTVERAAGIDLRDGRVTFISEGHEGWAPVPRSPANQKNRSISLTHWHPNGSGLSGADVMVTMKRKDLAEIRAFTPDGRLFRLAKDSPASDLVTTAEVDAVGKEYERLFREGERILRATRPDADAQTRLVLACRYASRKLARERGMVYAEVTDG